MMNESKATPWIRLKDYADARWNWTERWHVWRRWFPAIAFFVGFTIDIVNLSRGVKLVDLLMVSGYAVLAMGALVVRARAEDDRWKRWSTNGFQLFLGALFSAMVVLYFQSSGQFFSILFVLGLFVAQVANEFLHKDERQRRLVWAIYAVSVVMLLNFLIPHLVKSVSPIWFYVSTVLGLGVVAALRRLTGESWENLKVAAGVVATLVVLYIMGFVPPVPLVLEHQLECTDFKKSEYSCAVDDPTVMQMFGLSGDTVTTDGPVYVLTAVSAPLDVEVELEHVWYRDTDDGWKETDTMAFSMRGGRKDGWRFWSRKRNAKPGDWRVETRLKGGAVLGYTRFEVVPGEREKLRQSL